MRRVISLWLPWLASDRLTRGRARPGAEPFVLARSEGGRRLVWAAAPLAARAGIRAGMTVADSLALVPELDIVEADPAADAAMLHQLARWARRYTPWTAPMAMGPLSFPPEPGGEGALWLDITGCAHLFGGEPALLEDLMTRLARLGCLARAAIADTPGAAWALARFRAVHVAREGPAAIRATPGQARAELAPLPIAGLRLAPEMVDDLRRLGLKTIGALYSLPRPALVRRFGPQLIRRLDQALGDCDEPISPETPAAPLVERLTGPEPLTGPAALAATLNLALVRLCRRLERQGLAARRLDLALQRVDGRCLEMSVGTGQPTRDADHLARLFADRIERIDMEFGIESVTLRAALTESLAPRDAGFGTLPAHDGTAAAPDALARLADRLTARLGAAALSRFRPRESHMPERAVERREALAREMGARARWPASSARPVRLFVRPEPVEAMALLPDRPPVLFRRHHQIHRLVRAEGPERIAPEWWRATETPPRDYYRVEDETGARFWLYREGMEGASGLRWFLHGLFP